MQWQLHNFCHTWDDDCWVVTDTFILNHGSVYSAVQLMLYDGASIHCKTCWAPYITLPDGLGHVILSFSQIDYGKIFIAVRSLQLNHNEHNGISNHWCLSCLLNCLFSLRSKKTSKHHVTGLCEGNSLVTGEFPTQRASNAENVSIWWCHHGSWQRNKADKWV